MLGSRFHHHPRSLIVVVEFPSENAAVRFEKYLKSGSGRAFAEHHFANSGQNSACLPKPRRSRTIDRELAALNSRAS
jgi:hypothetical protein